PLVALRGAVLQHVRALAGDEVADHVADGVEGERGHVRHPAGEGDHLGTGGHREQSPDLGRHHAGGTRGVAVGVGICARVLFPEVPPRWTGLPANYGIACDDTTRAARPAGPRRKIAPGASVGWELP